MEPQSPGQSPPARPLKSFLAPGGAGLGLLLLVVVLFARAMTMGFNHDEQGYLVSGVLGHQALIYRDFGYNHMPYLPMLYGVLDRLFPISHHLLAGRLVVFVFAAVACVLMFVLGRRLSGRTGVGLAIAALFALNPFIYDTIGKAAKDYPGMAFALGGVYFLVRGFQSEKVGPWAPFLAGVSFACAAGFKLTYLPLAAAPFLVLAVSRRPAQALIQGVAPFLAGMVVGAGPLIALWLQAPEAFYFNNVTYHKLNTQWRVATRYPFAMTPLAKLEFFVYMLVRDASLATLAVALPAAGLAAWRWRAPGPVAGLLVTLTGASVVLALLPTPSFPHHFTIAVPYVLLGLAALYGALMPDRRRWGAAMMVVLVVVHLAQMTPRVAAVLARVGEPSGWTGMQIHGAAIALRDHLPEPSRRARLATLTPMFALEAGLPVYPELTTGPFFFRVGDLVPRETRDRFHMASAATVGALLDADPPGAILVGYEQGSPVTREPYLDEALERYAYRHGYEQVRLKGSRLVLLVRKQPKP
jgi:hypothetical protein